MSATVILTREAKADVAEAVAWYRQHSIVAAERFLAEVGAAISRIEAQPAAHVIIDAQTGTRRALLRRFPHRLLYLVDGPRLVVFAVMHPRRDTPTWQKRLK